MEVDPDVYEQRKKQIEGISDFIDSKYKELTELVAKLGWSVDSVCQQDKVQCRYNPGHWVKKSSLGKHEELCSLLSEGYTRQELAEDPPPSDFLYTDSVKIGKDDLQAIKSEALASEKSSSELFVDLGNNETFSMPKTVERFHSSFTPEERLAVYDYVVRKEKAASSSADVALDGLMVDFEKREKDEKPKTYLEILAEQRDYKRRRQSYRAKNVHITKKSYTEVMREVIENQTSYFAESMKQEEKDRQHEEHQLEAAASSHSESSVKLRDERESSSERSGRRRSRDRHRHHHHRRHERSRSRSSSRHRHKHKKHKKHKSHHK